jgi:hypothetical protein
MAAATMRMNLHIVNFTSGIAFNVIAYMMQQMQHSHGLFYLCFR